MIWLEETACFSDALIVQTSSAVHVINPSRMDRYDSVLSGLYNYMVEVKLKFPLHVHS